MELARLGDGSAYGTTGIPPLTGNTQPSQGDAEPPQGDDFALRVRAWFLEAVNHKFWKDWNEDSEEDMGFYVGGKGQWGLHGSYEDYENLVKQKRAHLSINHCQAPIDLMSGYERSNRMDVKATPQGDQDDDGAQIMSWFLKYAQNQTNSADVLSDMFEDGNIRGMDVCEVGVDYTGERPVNGEITVNRLAPGWGPLRDLIWDPFWTKYDFSDARYMLRYRWAFVADIIAEYPEHEEELRDAANRLRLIFGENKTSAQRGKDNYGYVRNHPVERLEDEAHFYYAADQRLLIVEAWYHVYYTKYAIFDKQTGKVTEVDGPKQAKDLQKSDPANLRIHRTESRRVRMALVIPATYTTIERTWTI